MRSRITFCPCLIKRKRAMREGKKDLGKKNKKGKKIYGRLGNRFSSFYDVPKCPTTPVEGVYVHAMEKKCSVFSPDQIDHHRCVDICSPIDRDRSGTVVFFGLFVAHLFRNGREFSNELRRLTKKGSAGGHALVPIRPTSDENFVGIIVSLIELIHVDRQKQKTRHSTSLFLLFFD